MQIPKRIKNAYLYATSAKNVETAYVLKKKVTTKIIKETNILENFVELMGVTFFIIVQHVFIVILR